MNRFVYFSILVAACGGTPSQSATPVSAPVAAHATVLGIAPRVAMLEVRLAAGEHFDAPPSRCQEAMMLVRAGSVLVAPEGDQALRLEANEAVRFGTARPATVDAGDVPSVLLVVVSRPADAPFDPARGIAGVFDPPVRCDHDMAITFERSLPADIGPFEHADGRLRVSIFLDARAQESVRASLTLLSGTNDVAVPRHAHEVSDEVLFIESGEGTMVRGDERVAVHGPAFVWVPAGMPHAFERSGDAPLVAYQVYSPAGPEQRFRRPTP
jgi:mannose-6-phosphate isomerase-like protein (cupin superfamily)